MCTRSSSPEPGACGRRSRRWIRPLYCGLRRHAPCRRHGAGCHRRPGGHGGQAVGGYAERSRARAPIHSPRRFQWRRKPSRCGIPRTALPCRSSWTNLSHEPVPCRATVPGSGARRPPGVSCARPVDPVTPRGGHGCWRIGRKADPPEGTGDPAVAIRPMRERRSLDKG